MTKIKFFGKVSGAEPARKEKLFLLLFSGLLALGSLIILNAAFAGDADDIAAMQKKLNQGVMQKEFSVEDSAKIEAYIKEGMQKDMKPRETPPSGWRAGYTCADLHNYYEYRDCMYYYRYHGYYWR
jgi:hypothetical protein